MAAWHGMMVKRSSERSMKDEEFQEEDMWDVVREKDDTRLTMKKSKDHCFGYSAWRSLHSPTVQEDNVGGQISAPLDIPDWSKIYGKSVTDYNHNGSDGKSSGGGGGVIHHGTYIDDDGEEKEDDMVPPHEYIAKRLARSGISSFSVCEGIGRTLKGRDLSKVRNAILTKTGFLE